jgi:hypothetical protein
MMLLKFCAALLPCLCLERKRISIIVAEESASVSTKKETESGESVDRVTVNEKTGHEGQANQKQEFG